MTRRPTALLGALLVAAALACQPADGGPEEEPGVMVIEAKDFEFEAPREVPSGWTTLRLVNSGEQDHFVYVYRLPDDVTFRQYRQSVPKIFSDTYARYDAGELTREETVETLGEELPEWFFTDVVPSGGVALTDAGATAESTIRLDPGTYVMECYVKTPEGTWHTDRGMLRAFTVTEEENGVEPPEADAEMTLSNYEIDLQGELGAGEQTIAVHVEDRPEGLMMHDVNLVRLDGDTSLDSVVAWMDWMDLEQFRHPAPGTNLGGVDQMVPGRTGYMTVTLEPGDYAWVSEEYASRGMVREFTVR